MRQRRIPYGHCYSSTWVGIWGSPGLWPPTSPSPEQEVEDLGRVACFSSGSFKRFSLSVQMDTCWSQMLSMFTGCCEYLGGKPARGVQQVLELSGPGIHECT